MAAKNKWGSTCPFPCARTGKIASLIGSRSTLFATIALAVSYLSGCALMSDRPLRLSFPPANELSQVKVTCRCSSRTIPVAESYEIPISDPRQTALIGEELAALSESWKTWGPTTLPAPEIRLELTFKSGQRMWFGTGNELTTLWNSEGRRFLSEAESNRLRQVLPVCEP